MTAYRLYHYFNATTSKIFSSFCLYIHFILDIILTHVMVITFLNAGFFSLAGILMGMDSLLRIAVLVPISRLMVNLNLGIRGRLSALLRLALIIIWFIAIIQIQLDKISFTIISLFIFFKLLLTIDSSLSLDFIFALKKYFHVDLTQITAAQNILVRSTTAIAPAVALLILTVPHATLFIAIIITVINIISIIVLYPIFFSPIQKDTTALDNPYLSFSKLLANPVMRLGLLLQIIGNLAFAGVAFLLLAELKLSGSLFLNEITVLYTSFFITQFLILIYGDQIVPANKFTHIILIMGVAGLLILGAGITQGIERILICGAIGLAYSLLISSMQKVITNSLQGQGFIEYASWGITAGRLTSFLVIVIFGEALSVGFSASTLLIASGFFGLIGAILLLAFRI